MKDVFSKHDIAKIDRGFESFIEDVIASDQRSRGNLEPHKGITHISRDCHGLLAGLAMTPLSSTPNNNLISHAIVLEEYIKSLFPIKKEFQDYKKQAADFAIIYDFKRNFVQRRAVRKYGKDDLSYYSPDNKNLPLLQLAQQVLLWLEDEEKYASELEAAAKYSAYKVYFDPDSVAFRLPQKLDFEHLVDYPPSVIPGCAGTQLYSHLHESGDAIYNTRSRVKPGMTADGFAIQDTSASLDQSHYCIYCHNQEKDSCRTGFKDGDTYKVNPLGNKLTGCPLEQKVSEMNYLYSKGNLIAALAVVMIDNPLVAATGDRICNDCMKSCIFQKQEPVDIPRVETQMLKDILTLPYGAEIYYLLSRWNPLCNKTSLPQNRHPGLDPGPSSLNKNIIVTHQTLKNDVLIKELGPGFRRDDGFHDTSQKILIIGLGPAGFAMAYYMLQRGHKVTAIDGLAIDKLPEEFLQPIKNWPKMIDNLGPYKPQGFGGVAEYGITDRWNKYNLLLIRMLLERFDNFEMKGDFRLGRDITIKDAIEKEGYDYVALCLGAGKPKVPVIKNLDAKGVISAFTFLASLHMNNPDFTYKMPVVIVGAGLTAIDCAMAALNYNKDKTKDVTIIYRKSMQESPSYKENHHELQMGLDLGVKFLENTELESIEVDKNNNIISINKTIPASTLIYSIGTHPNDSIFERESEAFKLYKDKIGIFGDMDPHYAGTVVKAIASVKNWLKSN